MLATLILSSLFAPASATEDPAALADRYVEAVESINRDHARKPGRTTESELSRKLPRPATRSLADLLEARGGADTLEALRRVGEAALDVDGMEDFAAVRARMAELAPDGPDVLGSALSRERFLLRGIGLRGIGGLDEDYLARFADVLDAVLDAYDEVFGFEELSKVPGKKIRVRVHLEERIERPPHFAPQHPFHSEIDFPVIDAERFASPTGDGKFLFYGLCHELGHLIAMWGRPDFEQDHHAWAHYTGIAIVEHLSRRKPGCLEHVRDERWRSMSNLRDEVGESEPGVGSRTEVLALLLALHDELGPSALGAAINHLDAEDDRRRVNHVRYYTFEELREGLEAVTKDRAKRKRIQALLR